MFESCSHSCIGESNFRGLFSTKGRISFAVVVSCTRLKLNIYIYSSVHIRIRHLNAQINFLCMVCFVPAAIRSVCFARFHLASGEIEQEVLLSSGMRWPSADED